MRVFLSTEGASDEVIAESLILSVDPFATIIKKTFTSRGFNVVRSLIPICVRAAHFGHFDALIVHFDLDATLPLGFNSVKESDRWQHAAQRVSDIQNALEMGGRTRGLATVFMAPCQSTDSWIDWALYGGDGQLCERK